MNKLPLELLDIVCDKINNKVLVDLCHIKGSKRIFVLNEN
jgi:hypothetical protein